MPAGGDRALQILAGLPEAVFVQGRIALPLNLATRSPRPRATWSLPRISGGKSQQTWSNLAHALQAAPPCCQRRGRNRPLHRTRSSARPRPKSPRRLVRFRNDTQAAAQTLTHPMPRWPGCSPNRLIAARSTSSAAYPKTLSHRSAARMSPTPTKSLASRRIQIVHPDFRRSVRSSFRRRSKSNVK